VNDQQATPKPEPESFSFASAMLCVDELFNALPKSKRMQYLGHFNEVAVVLTGAAGLLGIVRDEGHWVTPIGKVPRPAEVKP
jgi:hypothetical protein